MNATNHITRNGNYELPEAQYRPGYPQAIISFLEHTIGLKKADYIADIASGHAIFSELFLKAGYHVGAIEPDENKRKVAELEFNDCPRFDSINGSAAATTLSCKSVDLITVAQAFHLFDDQATKKEFLRVLKPSGHVLLVWNVLNTDTPFLKAYQDLIDRCTTNSARNSKRADLNAIKQFFYPSPVITHQFHYTQQLDGEELKGHLLSMSNSFGAQNSASEIILDELDNLLNLYAVNGLIEITYETKLFLIPSV